MGTILPLFLLLFGIVIILILLVRKYPQLTLLDVSSIEEVKLERKKDEYWKKRAEKKAEVSQSKWKQRLLPAMSFIGNQQRRVRGYMRDLEKKLANESEKRDAEKIAEQPVDESEKTRERLRKLIGDALFAFDNGEFEKAETLFIKAISIDTKNIDAYRGLAETYQKSGQLEEAKQTFDYLVHLDPSDDTTRSKYAELLEETDHVDEAIQQYEEAVLLNDSVPSRFAKLAALLERSHEEAAALEAMKQAVSLEPENPRYLDNMIELSILVQDKELAQEGYEQLRMVNPENAKLPGFREQISKLG